MILTITATGTGVGKTLVSSLIAQACDYSQRACWYLKPFQTGSPPDDDSAVLRDLNLKRLQVLEPWFKLAPPQAPLRAWRDLGQPIPAWDEITRRFSEIPDTGTLGIVEGAGGILVPITESKTFLDWFSELGQIRSTQMIVACGTALGTLNHTALTVQALRQRKIEPLGLITVGEPDPQTNRILSEQNQLAILNHVQIPLQRSDLQEQAESMARSSWFKKVQEPA